MVVLPSTGASRYHSLCIDGGTNPEYFEYYLAFTTPQAGGRTNHLPNEDVWLEFQER
jgi:hypothetical protein